MATPPPPTTAQTPSPPRRIVICGGGVIGSCTAYFLSHHHKSTTSSAATITLVEKSSVACAASGKAAGFLALDWADGTSLSSLSRASFSLHRTLSHRLHGPTAYAFTPLHSLSLSNPNPNPNENDHPLPSWIDGPIHGAPKTIGTPDTTALLHPKLFTQTLVRNSPGVHLLTGEIKNVEVDDGDRAVGVLVVVDQEERFVPADVVVLALGPWSSRLPIMSSLFAVSGVKAHSIVLRPADPGSITPHALFLGVDALVPGVYPRSTGEVYVCGMLREDEEVPDDPKAITGDPESIEALHRIAGTMSSRLRRGDRGGAEVVAEQACFMPCTDDGLPVIGEMPGAKGCYVATGHGGWGILHGPATGASLAELILEGRSSEVDLMPFSPSRFLCRVPDSK